MQFNFFILLLVIFATFCVARRSDNDEDLNEILDEINDNRWMSDNEEGKEDDQEEEEEEIVDAANDPKRNFKCGTGVFTSAWKCQTNGRCLCWWGWTGDNAVYIDGGAHNNRILANFCTRPCHYTHRVR